LTTHFFRPLTFFKSISANCSDTAKHSRPASDARPHVQLFLPNPSLLGHPDSLRSCLSIEWFLSAVAGSAPEITIYNITDLASLRRVRDLGSLFARCIISQFAFIDPAPRAERHS
jgi:hypothetical protein